MLISYAQNFEDVMLWRALRHVDQGCYIDVGAQDPDFDSVSRMFYEHGWRGVNVEPVDAYAAKLRARRPDELVIQVAVSDNPGILQFFDITETGLSTTDAAIAEEHRTAGFSVNEVQVSSITLDEVFDRVAGREVHWLKIDVEGAEAKVIHSWTSQVRPWVVVIESTRPLSTEPTHDQWDADVLAKGYTFAYFDGLNRFYVSDTHPELLSSFECAPNVFDGFVFGPESSFCLAARVQSTAQINNLQSEHQQVVHALQRESDERLADLKTQKVNVEALNRELNERVGELSAQQAMVSALRGELEERIAVLQAEHQMVELLKVEYAQAQSVTEACRAELNHFRHEAHVHRTTVLAMENSRSWRITAPLRKGTGLLRRLRHSPRQLLSDSVAASMRPVLRHPRLGPLVNAAVKRVPPLHARLRRMAQYRGMVNLKELAVVEAPRSSSQVGHFGGMNEADASKHLSTRARLLFARLVAEQESRGQ
jgi:FkbM family methyltransferase